MIPAITERPVQGTTPLPQAGRCRSGCRAPPCAPEGMASVFPLPGRLAVLQNAAMTRLLPALVAVALLPLPAAGEIARYVIDGDQSTRTPTDGTLLRPGSASGTAWIADDGGGAPRLERLELEHGYVATHVQNSSVVGTYELKRSLSAAPGQAGSGGTSDEISWGSLTGWSQTGFLRCPAECFATDPECESACALTFGFAGTGPLPPLAGGGFDSDPWVFDGDGTGFTAAPIEIVNLAGGLVTEHLVWRGSFVGPVPSFPLLATLALATGIALLGARALGGRR